MNTVCLRVGKVESRFSEFTVSLQTVNLVDGGRVYTPRMTKLAISEVVYNQLHCLLTKPYFLSSPNIAEIAEFINGLGHADDKVPVAGAQHIAAELQPGGPRQHGPRRSRF